MPERDAAEGEILRLVPEAGKDGLLLQPFRWEKDHYAASGEPQPPLTERLRRAEFVVVIVWTRIGPGTLEELRVALTQAWRGHTDNVGIYFKTEPPQGKATACVDCSAVQALRKELGEGKRALTWEFRSTDDFRQVFGRHLQAWLDRWRGVCGCCKYALENSLPHHANNPLGESRLTWLNRNFDLRSLEGIVGCLGAEAVKRFQRLGNEAIGQPLGRTLEEVHPRWQTAASPWTEFDGLFVQRATRLGLPHASPTPLRTAQGGDVYFADSEWFAYFCAVGLAAAITEGRLEAVATRPYPNPVHQYLSAYVQREQLKQVLPTLVRWLSNCDGITNGLPVARNFAAYVIGMLGNIDAQDDLAQALRNDPGEDVAIYCVTSLGKLRSRRHVPLLLRLFQQETDPRRRLLLSQAVCNTVGIAHYEL
jgi:hypothetical protein